MSNPIDHLSDVVSLLLAVSMSVERLLTAVKTLVPALAEERRAPDGCVDRVADRSRRLTLHLCALAAAWVTCALLVGRADPRAPVRAGDIHLPLWLVALLASGGSALWNDVLGYSKALKERTRAHAVGGAPPPTQHAR